MLLRNLIEAVVSDYLKRDGLWDQACQEQIETQNSKREKRDQEPLSLANAANVVPSLREKLAFIKRNADKLPKEYRSIVGRNLDQFVAKNGNLGELNGITYEDGLLTNRERVSAFRDRIVPVLEALLIA